MKINLKDTYATKKQRQLETDEAFKSVLDLVSISCQFIFISLLFAFKKYHNLRERKKITEINFSSVLCSHFQKQREL